jgi:bifunctional DNA-binding transcriptional regulator/antitoxin component of YhaV-PrlF toxin-antitoxin module
MERLRLKISPKGQITLPRKLREKLFIGNYVYLNLEKGKAVLEPVSFIDEFDDLIVRDVQKEGYTGEEAKAKVKEKKLALLKALEKELRESVTEADRDWEAGNTATLWPPKE